MTLDGFAAVLPPYRGLPGALEENSPLADDEMRRLTNQVASADFQPALQELNRARARRIIPDRRDRLMRDLASGMADSFFAEGWTQLMALQRELGLHPPTERRIIDVGHVLHIWALGGRLGHVVLCPEEPEFLCGTSVSTEQCKHAVTGAWTEAKRFIGAGEMVCLRCESARVASLDPYPECDTPGPGSGGTPSEQSVLRLVAESALLEWLAAVDHRRCPDLASTRGSREAVMWQALDSWSVDAARDAGDRPLAVVLGSSYPRVARSFCSAFHAAGLAELMGDAYWSQVRRVLRDFRNSGMDVRSPAFRALGLSAATIRLRALAGASGPSRAPRLMSLLQLHS